MRILVVNNLYPPVAVGGYERECACVVERLRRRHEVCVLTSQHGRATAPPAAGVLRDLPFLDWGKRGSLRAPVAAVQGARTARRVLREFGPDLIYVWNGAQIPAAALRALECSEVPLAYRLCEGWLGYLYSADKFMKYLPGRPGTEPESVWRGPRRAWAALMRIVNRHPELRVDLAGRVPAAIEWNSQALRRLTPLPQTIDPVLEDVIYPVTDQAARFVGLERHPASAPLILFMGRVAPEKGLDVAYAALAALDSRHGIRARLVVAGPLAKGMRRELDALARRLGVTERVALRGELDAPGLRALLAEAHVVLVPPTWQEPAPLVCIEAAAARVPVVASNSGGIPELLHHGEHALLFPIGAADACADALAETLNDGEATLERVERAFRRSQEFTLDTYLDATERFVARATAALGR